jgi:ATP-dependent exoDNAse (exonuclease V) alpha subunit
VIPRSQRLHRGTVTSSRRSEATGTEARILHRLLKANPTKGGFRRDADTPLGCDLLAVEETSMVDVPLANVLPDAAALLVVGDVDQLMQHHAMLQRNLLYTSVTCGKRLMVLLGQPEAIAIAVHGTAGAAPLVAHRGSACVSSSTATAASSVSNSSLTY